MTAVKYEEYGRPLAILPSAIGAEFMLLVSAQMAPPFELCGPAAVVDIRNPLVHYESPRWDSYESIRKRTEAAFMCPEARAVILRIDSPGGDVDGCFDLARELREMPARYGKRLVSYSKGTAASAAYALASAGDALHISSTAIVGSIGVIMMMGEQTALDRGMGLRFSVAMSGARKGDGNPHVPMSDGAVAALQARVDQLAGVFFDVVSEQRRMTVEDVQAMQAGVFIGSKAVERGLADHVSTWSELLASLDTAQSASSQTTSPETSMGIKDDTKAYRAKLETESKSSDEKEAAYAKRMLAGLDEAEKEPAASEEPPAEESEEDKKKKKDAEEAKAAEEKKTADAKASARASTPAASAQELGLAQRLHHLETKLALKEENTARAELLAKRPDFSAKVRASLERASLAFVKEAVETWDKGPGAPGASSAAAALGVAGTRGETQASGKEIPIDEDEASLIDSKMGFGPKATGIERNGRELVLGFMSPEQVDAKLAELAKGNV